MNTLVCTVCCREKRPDPGLLPARERYLSRRIARTESLAENAGLTFAILSGKYGLIDADRPIPYYDKLMAVEEIGSMAEANAVYLAEKGIEEVIFLSARPEDDPHSKPYLESIREGTNLAGARLKVVFIPPYPVRLV